MIKVYEPKISVRLLKVIARTEIDEGMSTPRLWGVNDFDLTPYLGEQGGVKTTKGVKEPAGGFSITLADRMHPDYLDTMYGLIEPMDLIEIRMAHDPSIYYDSAENTYRLPIIMRGFVSEVHRDESMGDDGKPTRRVTISGQDYGKILQVVQIIYLNNSAVGDNIISGFPMMQKYGIDTSRNQPANEFVEQVFDKIINPWLERMIWWDMPETRTWTHIAVEASVEGNVSGPAINAWPGGQGIYSLLAQVCDVSSGFNELFVKDYEDGIFIVLRPTPWRTPTGDYIQDIHEPGIPQTIEIDDSALISLSSARTDQAVANFFWVRAPHFEIISDQIMRMDASLVPVTGHANCDPTIYGIRQMDSTTYMGKPEYDANQGDHEEVHDRQWENEEAWRRARIRIITDASKDSVVFERGTMRLRGNERIAAGMFLILHRGVTDSEYYVTNVEHDYIPYQGFFTSIQYERGTGFIDRAQVGRSSRGGDSPYLGERNERGV